MVHQADMVVGEGVPRPSLSSGPEDCPALALRRSAAMQRNLSLNSVSALNGWVAARPAMVEFRPPPGMMKSGKPGALLLVMDADRTSFSRTAWRLPPDSL
jgi:hypothetical protein